MKTLHEATLRKTIWWPGPAGLDAPIYNIREVTVPELARHVVTRAPVLEGTLLADATDRFARAVTQLERQFEERFPRIPHEYEITPLPHLPEDRYFEYRVVVRPQGRRATWRVWGDEIAATAYPTFTRAALTDPDTIT